MITITILTLCFLAALSCKIKKAKLPEDCRKFDMLTVADMSKIKMLHKPGVKELEIRATMFKASAD